MCNYENHFNGSVANRGRTDGHSEVNRGVFQLHAAKATDSKAASGMT